MLFPKRVRDTHPPEDQPRQIHVMAGIFALFSRIAQAYDQIHNDNSCISRSIPAPALVFCHASISVAYNTGALPLYTSLKFVFNFCSYRYPAADPQSLGCRILTDIADKLGIVRTAGHRHTSGHEKSCVQLTTFQHLSFKPTVLSTYFSDYPSYPHTRYRNRYLQYQ